MKLTVGRHALDEAVRWAARGLSSRPAVPVLAGARLEVSDGRLSVTGADGDVAAGLTLEVEGAEDGVALVHGRLLADIVRTLPDEPVDLVVTGSELEVSCGSAAFALPVMPIEDHPGAPMMPPIAGTVDAVRFAAAVAQVTVAASRDDAVPVLTAVRCELGPTAIGLLATDRYRLAARTVPWEPADPWTALEVLVPARVLGDVAKAFAASGSGSGSGSGTIGLAVAPGPRTASAGSLGFIGGGRWFITRLYDGQYPPVHRLLDAARPGRVRVPVAGLLDAVRRVALVAERHTAVTLTVVPGRIRVEARGAYQARAHDELTAQYEGEPFTMAFTAPYLLDGLVALGAEVAEFHVADGTKPPLLTGAGADGRAPADDLRYLIQPVRARP